MNKSSLCVPSSPRVALVSRNKCPSSTIERVWLPIAVSRRTNSLASESGVRVRAPNPGILALLAGAEVECVALGVWAPAKMEYPPAPAAKATPAIVSHAFEPKLGSEPSGGSGIINHQATIPIRMSAAPPNG